MGLAIYYNFRDVRIAKAWYIGLLAAAVAVFVFYPSSGDQIRIVTGASRMVLSLVATSIVLAFWKCPPRLPGFIGNPLEQLGIATYGVYLLHPFVMQWAQKRLQLLGIYGSHLYGVLVVVFTISFALLTFRFLESPLIKLGKRFTQGHLAHPIQSTSIHSVNVPVPAAPDSDLLPEEV